jgi:PIN domain nuclease of toxin-antitoxin system
MNEPVLVDTHILLWMRADPKRLTKAERKLLDDAPRICVSVATLWEIAILISIWRLDRDERLLEVPAGLELLPILPEHLKALLKLPFHHRDPFDRMLVAQADAEGLALLTRDAAIERYRQPADKPR